jgi:hypothetical protein
MEMQINNMREYYDREQEAKEAKLKEQAQEIELLRAEIA